MKHTNFSTISMLFKSPTVTRFSPLDYDAMESNDYSGEDMISPEPGYYDTYDGFIRSPCSSPGTQGDIFFQSFGPPHVFPTETILINSWPRVVHSSPHLIGSGAPVACSWGPNPNSYPYIVDSGPHLTDPSLSTPVASSWGPNPNSCPYIVDSGPVDSVEGVCNIPYEDVYNNSGDIVYGTSDKVCSTYAISGTILKPVKTKGFKTHGAKSDPLKPVKTNGSKTHGAKSGPLKGQALREYQENRRVEKEEKQHNNMLFAKVHNASKCITPAEKLRRAVLKKETSQRARDDEEKRKKSLVVVNADIEGRMGVLLRELDLYETAVIPHMDGTMGSLLRESDLYKSAVLSYM
jgi:hypothetical protein